MSPQEAGERPILPFDHPMHLAAHRFLVREAHAQDRHDFETWLTMMAPDVVYQAPVTATTGAGSHKAGEMDHFAEDLYSLRMRVARLKSNLAWSENPPSRTRHFIANVCTCATAKPDEVRVWSAILVFRTQGDGSPDVISGMRDDVLRQVGDELFLVRRMVSLDEAVLRTKNLAIFL